MIVCWRVLYLPGSEIEGTGAVGPSLDVLLPLPQLLEQVLLTSAVARPVKCPLLGRHQELRG